MQETYYTTQFRPKNDDLFYQRKSDWERRDDTCYVRGVNLYGKFQQNALEELKELVTIANKEHTWSEYRIVKVTEEIEVV